MLLLTSSKHLSDALRTSLFRCKMEDAYRMCFSYIKRYYW